MAVRDGVAELKTDTPSSFLVPPEGIAGHDGVKERAARNVVKDEPATEVFVVMDDAVDGKNVGVVADGSMVFDLFVQAVEVPSALLDRVLLLREGQANPLDCILSTGGIEKVDSLIDDAESALSEN
jgi:hypothetical protein